MPRIWKKEEEKQPEIPQVEKTDEEKPIQLVTENMFLNAKLDHIISILERLETLAKE